MKNLSTLSILFILTILPTMAQVGIGTVTPQQALHIAGDRSTIRIDGLNSSNHPENQGGASMYNVMVNSEGDLAIGQMSGEVFSGPIVSSPVLVRTTANSGLNASEISTKSFTLTQRAMVVITYYISMEFDGYNSAAKIDDGRAKVAHNYFYLGNGTTANPAKAYGMTSSVYSNVNCDAATGYIFNSRSTTLLLEAGTHSIHMQGAVFGGDLNAEAAFQVGFGAIDRLDISA
ncbi:MAG: hypothetical protein CMC08_08265, partial [Flavobacteriaceae bacterium]|nr:hypothetical protein [Flavobacteriaceae bacterium]